MYNVKRLEKMKKTDRNAILEWAEKTGADEQTQARIKAVLDDMDALDVINSVNVEQALHSACLSEFIASLEKGVDTSRTLCYLFYIVCFKRSV